MKKNLAGTLVVMILCLALLGTVGAQTQGQKTLASTINVYVFPTEGQTAEQQSKDEAECYSWAVSNTGTDPFDLAKQAEKQKVEADQAKAQVKDAGKGAGAKGAVKGAAAGALIGEIASDDPGKGAAYGAAAGAIRGRRSRARAQQSAQKQIEAQATQAKAATEEAMTNFKKAFSVCLEAKKYMAKY